jgi:hypothetical protein
VSCGLHQLSTIAFCTSLIVYTLQLYEIVVNEKPEAPIPHSTGLYSADGAGGSRKVRDFFWRTQIAMTDILKYANWGVYDAPN